MSKHAILAMPARLIGGALLAGFASLSSVETASAQVYGGFYARTFAYPHPGFFPPAPIPAPRRRPGFVLASVADQGYEPIGIVGRRGDVMIVEAFSPRNERVRLVVDAFDGEILERFTIRPNGAAPGPAGRGTEPHRRDPARDQNAAAPRKSPEKLAELPAPPRRPAATGGSVAPVTPRVAAPMTRRLDDWAPINSVPVAPLE